MNHRSSFSVRPSLRVSAAALLLATGAALAQPARDAPTKAPAPKEQQPADPKKKPEAATTETKEITNAEELLAALETADKKISTITAELNFTTVASEVEGNDRQRRHGWLHFRNRSDAKTADGKPAPDSHAAASVRFDTLIQASNKQFEEKKTYVVNGPVVIERIEKEKLMYRYRIGRQDKPQDPLKLGEGPFPLPFGQQKQEVLSRFDALLTPSLENLEGLTGGLRERLQSTYQLKLTPKKEAGVSSDVKEIRVWYQKSDMLPVLARIMRPGGGFDEFYLVGIQVNKPLPANVFDTSVPQGWKVEEKDRP